MSDSASVVAHGDADEFEPRAGAIGEFLAVLEQEGGDLGTDAAAAEEGDAEVAVLDHLLSSFVGGAVMPASRLSRSASVSPRMMILATPSRTATTGGRPR